MNRSDASPAPPAPTAVLSARIAAQEATLASLATWDRRLSTLRVLTFAAAAALWAVWASRHEGVRAALPSGRDAIAALAWAVSGLFGVWVAAHRICAGRRENGEARLAAQRLAWARVHHDWPALAGRGEVALPRWASSTQHQTAGDLDLAGEGRALFALLRTTEASVGLEVLWRFLLHPAAADEVAARQATVRALAPHLELRESLAVLGRRERTTQAAPLDLATLTAWGEAPARLAPGPLLGALGACHLAVGASGAAWWLALTGPGPLLCALAGQWLVARLLAGRVAAVLADAAGPSRVMARLAGRLGPLMAASVDDPGWRAELAALRAGDASGPPGATAVGALGQLDRLCRAADAAANQAVAPIVGLVLWVPHAARGIEAWRQRHGRRLGAWLHALARLEAYVLAGGYVFEHPQDAWPEPATPASGGDEGLTGAPPSGARAAGPARFEAEELAHPLIAPGIRVANDVSLHPAAPALLVSGSNMSGKSTLLRAAGLAAVMARAGLPVAARRLVVGPLEVASSMRVADSLAAGTSHFWAEVEAVKRVCDAAARRPPALFLLDEIFHGTNSLDRRVGAIAVVDHLRRQGAIGIMTTHDLTLTEDAAGHQMRNVHFVDSIEAGRPVFDYRMHAGVVTHSNALRLMRAAGLDV